MVPHEEIQRWILGFGADAEVVANAKWEADGTAAAGLALLEINLP